MSRREADYLLAIYRLSNRRGVRLKDVARTLGVNPSTAAEALANLALKGLVVKLGRGLYLLSPFGLEVVKELLRKHRILETFLARALDMDVDEACAYAACFDFSVPSALVDRMCSAMGHPSYCPHGNPIPAGRCHKEPSRGDSCGK